ncbi:MAG: pyridoxamine 5'-phosphate oxidase family protein [Maribacter sp.]
MTEVFFEELSNELHKGVNKKGHPFRYLTMATVGNSRIARLRTVVLRQVSEDLNLTIFTDGRTKKIEHIDQNNWVSLLFYHPKSLLQLKIEGKAVIVKDKERLQKYWSGVQPSSRKDYITETTPGTEIDNPDHVEYLEDENFFTMIDIIPEKIEYLKLKRPNHLRVLFTRRNEDWKGSFLVP